jgi:hypothetical protein
MGMLSPKFGRTNTSPSDQKTSAKKTAFPMFGGFMGNGHKKTTKVVTSKDLKLINFKKERPLSSNNEQEKSKIVVP